MKEGGGRPHLSCGRLLKHKLCQIRQFQPTTSFLPDFRQEQPSSEWNDGDNSLDGDIISIDEKDRLQKVVGLDYSAMRTRSNPPSAESFQSVSLKPLSLVVSIGKFDAVLKL